MERTEIVTGNCVYSQGGFERSYSGRRGLIRRGQWSQGQYTPELTVDVDVDAGGGLTMDRAVGMLADSIRMAWYRGEPIDHASVGRMAREICAGDLRLPDSIRVVRVVLDPVER